MLKHIIKDKDCVILLGDHTYFRKGNREEEINKLAPNCYLVDCTKLKKSIAYRCLGSH